MKMNYSMLALDIEKLKKRAKLKKIGAIVIGIAVMEAFYIGMRLATVLTDILCFESDISKLAFKEFVYTVVALILLILYGPRKMRVFRKSCVIIPKYISFSMILVYMTSAALRMSLLDIQYGIDYSNTRPITEIVLYTILVLLVGIAEETIFRGIISEKMICAFGRTLAGRQKAATISGIMFGMMHLVNMSHSETIGVIVQAVAASVVGILFSEIYYLTKSLWPVIIIHSVNDFVAMSPYGIFGTMSFDSMISLYKPVMILPFIMLFIMYNCMYSNMKRLEEKKPVCMKRKYKYNSIYSR